MNKRPVERPKRLKAFFDNYKAAFLIAAVLLLTIAATAQVDTTKQKQQINAYGYYYKNISVDSSLRIPRDTFKLKMADSGSLAWKNGRFWQWSGYQWDTLQATGGGGSGTTVSNASASGDTISVAGVLKRLAAGYGILHTVTGTSITSKVDTSAIATVYSLRDSTVRLLRNFAIPARMEFTHSGADSSGFQDTDLEDALILSVTINGYTVGFNTRAASVYMAFDATYGRITLTNGVFTDTDNVIIVYRTSPIFLTDGSGNFIRDADGNYIILN